MTLGDEEALGIFERKILRCILGGIQVNGSWRRFDVELNKIYKQPDIVKFIKLQRLKWTGHLARMNEDRCCKTIILAKPSVSGQRLRKTDRVDLDEIGNHIGMHGWKRFPGAEETTQNTNKTGHE
ncbi:uncharacterized transposon-derived protein F52C9.6 [Trichonephila clavipes]|nr:uncharacterized transposon-derived protein F52C9.6 [Trichonephila clavipes]